MGWSETRFFQVNSQKIEYIRTLGEISRINLFKSELEKEIAVSEEASVVAQLKYSESFEVRDRDQW